ncbi:MAG: cation diffusion facilitator family transporter [Robiginitomaculum sp.]
MTRARPKSPVPDLRVMIKAMPPNTDTPINPDDHGHNCAQPELHEDIARGRGRLSAPGRIDPNDAARITRRITAYSVAVGVILIALKFVIWQQSQSVSILSSLVHSSLDFIAALATFFGVRYAARAPDRLHSFGRGKAEGFIAVLQACLVTFSAAHIFEAGIERFMSPQPVAQGGAILLVMGFAIAISGWLLMVQSHAIRSTGSVAIRGDRAHFLADMAANIAVVIGVGFAAFTPFARADAIVALLISAWLLFTAFRVGAIAFNQLMDRELPDEERAYIRALAAQDERILEISDLRTRASGPHVHIQMRAALDTDCSLLQAHEIIASAQTRILCAFPAADVTIHPDPLGHSHGNARFKRAD